MRLSQRELWPKLYSEDAFPVSCEARDDAGAVVTSDTSPEVIIFDERGEQYASTFINCPLEQGSQPSQVNDYMEDSINKNNSLGDFEF